jgi:hypothetical protein
MGEILRPRFGQPCFVCEDRVPEPRIRMLREVAATRRRRFLKSDVICVACERKAAPETRGGGSPARL